VEGEEGRDRAAGKRKRKGKEEKKEREG